MTPDFNTLFPRSPLFIGKRANPPRYWKTKVFPLALEFIAATVAGMDVRCGRRADIHETASSKPLDSAQSDRAAVIERAIPRPKDIVGESSSRGAEETMIADVGGSGGAGGCASRIVNPGYASEYRFSPVSTDTVEGSGDSSLGPNQGVVVGHYMCSTPAATSGAGRCLVVCPTGAEASVVICLAALIAFYPSSRGSPEKGGNRSPPAQLAGEKLGSSPGSRGSEKIAYGELEAEYLGGVRGGFEVLQRGDGAVTKADVRWRFLLLQQECPWARPPRRLMQELNEYFMTPGEHSWWTLSDRFL